MNRLRIALVHAHHWEEVPRGGERYLADLAWYLAGRGHQVDVVTGTVGASRDDDHAGARVLRRRHLPMRGLARWDIRPFETFGARVLLELAKRRYDVVHALTPTAAIAARTLAHPTVFTALGHPTEEQFGWRPLDRRIFGLAVRSATAVTAFSEASADQVRRLFGRPARALPLGLRSDLFPPRLEPRLGPPRLLLAGAPGEERKGLDVALQAMPTVLERYPDARLLLLSAPGEPGWPSDGLAAAGARVAAAVEAVGRLPFEAMPALYRSATVAILPAVNEAFGVALVEALASGTPVVCSRDGGMPEILAGTDVGRLVPPRDPSALAAAIHEVVAMAGKPDVPTACANWAGKWDWQRAVGPAHEHLYGQVSPRDAGAGPPAVPSV
jgi:glycosyltransferase involved in cell wall biosynthesis